MAFSLQANYTDWAAATGLRILVRTFVDRCDAKPAQQPPQMLILVF
jgi:hypothetical protein